MKKVSLAQLPAKLYALLEPLPPDERARALRATMALLGDQAAEITPPDRNLSPSDRLDTSDPSTFMDRKAPKNKGETLAVAARFRELSGEESHSKADLKKVVTDARRNFDDRNYARDINNAKRQAGFFNLGDGRDSVKLSYYGQRFVDALPDREAAAKLARPKVGGKRGGRAKARRGR
jgi:hypothetical protein